MFTLGVLSRVLILTAAAAPIAAGQGTQPWDQILRLAPGSEVRVVAGNSKPINGTLDGVTADALQLNSGGSQQSIQRGEILSIAVKKGGHRLRNGMIGLAVGAGAGLGVGLATTQNGSNGWGTLNADVRAGLTAAGGFVGFVIGVLLPSGGWHTVYKR